MRRPSAGGVRTGKIANQSTSELGGALFRDPDDMRGRVNTPGFEASALSRVAQGASGSALSATSVQTAFTSATSWTSIASQQVDSTPWAPHAMVIAQCVCGTTPPVTDVGSTAPGNAEQARRSRLTSRSAGSGHSTTPIRPVASRLQHATAPHPSTRLHPYERSTVGARRTNA